MQSTPTLWMTRYVPFSDAPHHHIPNSQQRANNRAVSSSSFWEKARRRLKSKSILVCFKIERIAPLYVANLVDTGMSNTSDFLLKKEDHTLGNLLSDHLKAHPNVLMAGYKGMCCPFEIPPTYHFADRLHSRPPQHPRAVYPCTNRRHSHRQRCIHICVRKAY